MQNASYTVKFYADNNCAALKLFGVNGTRRKLCNANVSLEVVGSPLRG